MSAAANRLHRPAFELFQGGNDHAPSWRWFCGSCGERPVLTDALPSARRVCPACEFGLLLQATADETPAPGAPFLVVDASFAVQALSKAAETLLAIDEASALNRHVTELLIPADRSAAGTTNLAVALSMAARGEGPASQATVCRANTFGERTRARISTCGPPPAALIVLS